MRLSFLFSFFLVVNIGLSQLNFDVAPMIYFDFNNNVDNQARDKFHGEITNGSLDNFVPDYSGNPRAAYLLTSDNEDIRIVDSLMLNGQFTISIDVYSTKDNSSNLGVFFSSEDSSGNNFLDLGFWNVYRNSSQFLSPSCTLSISNPNYMTNQDDPYIYDYFLFGDTARIDRWVNFIYEFNKDSMTFYKSGVKGVSSKRYVDFDSNLFGQIEIGKWNDPISYSIDNLLVFNRLLSKDEIGYIGDLTNRDNVVGFESNFGSSAQDNFYPNPTKDQLNFSTLGAISIMAVDSQGIKTQLSFTESIIDLANLGSGIYEIIITYDDRVVSEKIVKLED